MDYDRALAALKINRLDIAVEAISNGLSKDPDDSDLHVLMSIVQLRWGNFVDARRFAESAIRCDPLNPDGFLRLALAVVSDANLNPALQTWPGIDRLKARNGHAQRLEVGHALVNQAKQLTPEYPEVYALQSELLLTDEKIVEALQSARAGLEFDAEHHRCSVNELRALQLLGQTDQAIQLAHKRLEFFPDSDQVHHQLSRFYLEKGRIDQAILHGRTALSANPNDSELQESYWDCVSAQSRFLRPIVRFQFWVEKAKLRFARSPYLWIGLSFVACILTVIFVNRITGQDWSGFVIFLFGTLVSLFVADRPLMDFVDLWLLRNPMFRGMLDPSFIRRKILINLMVGLFYFALLCLFAFRNWQIPAILFAAVLYVAQIVSFFCTHDWRWRIFFPVSLLIMAGLMWLGLNGLAHRPVDSPPLFYVMALISFAFLGVFGPMVCFRGALQEALGTR